ncbi:phage tail tube protein [Marinococcus luteus]|uniref:phage tail tube protein n=1 Tax=Marinococcus luteus TaxID=1122204 RepID=UPI002ACC754F|nr:phage tail tube protein [Marinococcus luteus]MDZ5782109.1 hypothetical protein [Marinococcus luteus]
MSITRYVKVGEEETFAEETAVSTETIDPESAEIDPVEEDKMVYPGMSGLDRIVATGVYSTEGSFTLPMDSDVAPLFFKWALGGYEVEGDTDSYTHTFYPSTTPLMDSFTMKVGKDIMEHVFLGNAITNLELAIENEWASLTVETVGAKDKRSDLDEDSEFTEGDVFAAHQVTIDREDTDISPDIDAMTLTVETGANVEDAQGPGSRYPQRSYRGSMVVNLEMTIGFVDESDLQRFWGGNDGPADNEVEESKYVLHIGEDIALTFPRMIYMSSTQPVEGRDHIVQTITARALVDQSEGTEAQGPMIMDVTNSKESYHLDDLTA